MSTPSLTLLAPARDLEVGKAAIKAGADAVYIGAPRFGARQAAGNSIEDIAALVTFARPFGVQVLVTLNTLLTDEEMPEAVQMAWSLYNIGVSALIIQDLRLLQQDLPPIRLHASTQCDNRTIEHIQELERLGFSRVVLARELTLSEIRAIREQTQIELEAFIHGALCVCYSGRCYMSEVLLNRSANRGCCAQMCRMRYDLLDANQQEVLDDKGRPIHQRYLLSLQDMDRSAALKEMIDAGVTTFKIEGRLKDAEYVTNVTAYYRQLLDAAQKSPSQNLFSHPFTPNPQKTFHRGGIDYFLHGRTPHMANWETPKSTGEYIGQILPITSRQHTGKVRIRLIDGITLHNGDGLCIGDCGFAINHIEFVSPKEVILTPSSGGNIPMRETAVYRNLDTEFVGPLKAERHILIDACFEDTPTGFRLSMGGVKKEFTYEHQLANHPERVETSVREQLSKLGDTIFTMKKLDIRLSQPYFIPLSVLNTWRREVTEMLLSALQDADGATQTNAPIHRTNPKEIPSILSADEQPLMTCRYCLLHEMGHCRKLHPLKNEPRYLRLQNGTIVALQFDCARCEMRIMRYDF